MIDEKKTPIILVVDDEESIRYSFETFLVDDGYKVASAANLRDGLELLETLRPSIIFSDIILGNDDTVGAMHDVHRVRLHHLA